MHGNQRQTLLAYTAGILDADGCFMITKSKRNSFSPTYLPTVKIAMIEKEAIESICIDLGYGTYRREGARPSRPTAKALYVWSLRNKRNLFPFLGEVIPFLKVKKERANFLWNYCKKVRNCSLPSGGLQEEELLFREESYQKMRKLNEYKVAATTESLRPERVSDSLTS